MLVAILLPVVSLPIYAAAADSFTDISTYQYKDSIEFLYKRGVVKGYPDGTFGPGLAITRAEMMKIILE